jgi:hypothetical protein
MNSLNLKLFLSHPRVTGGRKNTSFLKTPTEITLANARDHLRNDYMTVRCKGGHCKDENFKCATAISISIDNSNSDVPEDWVYPSVMAHRLQRQSINYWMVADRSHLLPMKGKVARPMFHVHLPLAKAFARK